MKTVIKNLKTLTKIDAMSGGEHLLAKYLKKEYTRLGYQTIEDNLGNIFALKKSKNPSAKRLLITGHMDEVGFIILKIQDNGFIKVNPLGGINPKFLPSTRVRLLTNKNRVIHGTINMTAPHLNSERGNQEPNVTDLLFDFGFKSALDAQASGVEVGSLITFDTEFTLLNKGQRILSKAIDDRYGIALGLEVLSHYQNQELPFDLVVGGLVQEEVGTRGAKIAGNYLKADFGIILDCSPARDDSDDEKDLGRLGQGVLIRFYDPTMIQNEEITKWQWTTLEKAKIKYQYYMSPGSTDAGSLQFALDGLACFVLGIPVRNIHSPSSIIDTQDLLSASKAIIALIDNLDPIIECPPWKNFD
jgi:glutamyl aminopeptidase